MTASLSVQLFSLGTLPARDPEAVVERLAEIGYAGVEPMILRGTEAMLEWARSMGAPEMEPVDLVALRAALDAHGMTAPSSHCMLPEGPDAEQILDEQDLLGSTRLVVPALFNAEARSVEAFDDLDRLKRLAERFNEAADLARPRGIRIGYHNHFWEFGTDFDGMSGLETFYEMCEPDVFAEVDLYWAQLGGRDPVDLLTSLGERVELLHVKDGDGESEASCPLGEGVLDVQATLAAASSATWHVVELEGLDEEQVWPLLEQSHDHLVGAGFSTGRTGGGRAP
jgi:sugar phosphate isomerase/epimerase